MNLPCLISRGPLAPCVALAALLTGCGDDGSADTESTAEAGTETESSTETGSGTETESGTQTETESGMETESGTETGPACEAPLIDLPPIATFDFAVPEFMDLEDHSELFPDADGFSTYFVAMAPPVLSLSDQWGLLYSDGLRAFPHHKIEVTGVSATPDCALVVDLERRVPGESCESFDWLRPSASMVAVEASFAAFDMVGELSVGEVSEVVVDCGADGVGEFNDCGIEQPCGPGLICAGLTRSSGGLCMPVDQKVTTLSQDVDQPIPAGQVSVFELEMEGLATVDMDVVISLDLDHPDPSALTITLTNPDTNEVMVWDQEPGPAIYPWAEFEGPFTLRRAPVGFSGDETVNGDWILTITNDGEAGTMLGWGLEIMSRFD